MSYEYSENILVQENAGKVLNEKLGWDVKFAFDKEVLGEDGTFGRSSYHDVMLKRYFRFALKEFNSWINERQIDEAQRKMEEHLSSASLMQVNEEKYNLIRDGIPVKVTNPDGTEEERKAVVINFNEPIKNHFLAVKELKIHGSLYRRRTDIVGFVNGLPLLFIELKKNTVDVQNAYTDNYTDYLDTIPHLFYYNAFIMLSNGVQAKIGTLGSKYEFFHEWKRLKEDDEGSVDLETMLLGVCKKENFIDLLENFILYDHSNGKTAKILARNHQYLGVNEAVKAYKDRALRNGKLGVFWHTQGSGKSYSMIFLSQKIMRKFDGSPTIVVLTDRDELNTQISDTFENCGMLGKSKAASFIATSGEDLVSKLKGNPGFIFTLIHKFNKNNPEPIYPDHDIIIMSDEAHRTQNGLFAENMVAMLPTASRIGFTGTPLFDNDEITKRTFGGYVSIYDFKRAVDDGATVPLYYENRAEKLKDIKNPDINEKILEAIEAADVNPDQEVRLEQEFSKEIHVLTAEPRLDEIAKDFVHHYTELWTAGKAMFVCLNKVTCVRMYNLAQKYWAIEIENLKAEIKHSTQQEALELNRKLKWMEETEMAVVISQEQNEIQTFKKWGLDIIPHREKMEKRHLDKEFKDADNPFRIVFVCAMWMTGFDVKPLSNLYLDKPLKAHTLMQAIARANRVSEGKSNGLVLDYVGIVKALRKALATYTNNPSGNKTNDPTINKDELLNKIFETIEKSKELLKQNGFELKQLVEADSFKKLSLVLKAADAVSVNDETRKKFITLSNELIRLCKYIEREAITYEKRQEKNAITAIHDELQKKKTHVDITDLMVQINQIMNEYISVEVSDNKESRQLDISKINFELLRKEFERSKTQNLVLHDLEELIKKRLEMMMLANPSRVNFFDRYQKIINDYNQEQNRANIEKTFDELLKLSNSLDEEQQRYVREGFENDEQLSLYDLLKKENLTKEEIKKLKEASKELLSKVKEKIAELDHWADKPDTCAMVENIIRDVLWGSLPNCYDDNSITFYRKRVYEYVYGTYGFAA